MVTTFERLAKVLKGYVKPANWIERAFASIGSAILPSVSGSDNGKILGVSAGNWAVVEPPKELPSVTSVDNGKVLGVDDGAWGAIDVPKELPSVTSDDKGKFLKANDSTGALEWASAGSGAANALVFTVASSTVTGSPSYDEILAFETAVGNGEAGYVLVDNEGSYRIFDYYFDSHSIVATHLFFTSGAITQASISFDDRGASYMYEENVIYTPNS